MQAHTPVTFGQVFAQGHLTPGTGLRGQLPGGGFVPLQMDVKATHPDGSVRHAIISARVPSVAAGQVVRMWLLPAPLAGSAIPTPRALLASGFSAVTQITENGVVYTASAQEALRAGQYTTWLSGPVVGEWLMKVDFKDASGNPHPHLVARYAVRSYDGQARVDVTVENNWAYEAAPRNLTYDLAVLVDGAPVYSKAAVTHFHHARWRKTFWRGGDTTPAIDVRHDAQYLVDTRAVPNFDTSITPSTTAIANYRTKWLASNRDIMGNGVVTPHFPGTGGRADIGPLPAWHALYVLSQDPRMKEITLNVGDLAGSFSVHYRDKKTDLPVSLNDYPSMTLVGTRGDTYNSATKTYDAFPACGGICKSPYTVDTAHQPSMAYVPYLVTGDYYHLEELQFWANYNVFTSNPGYRQRAQGLVYSEQVRGQAWSMRTLGHAAYITPDKHPLKPYFNKILENNLAWYNQTYVQGNRNNLGVLDGASSSYTVVYPTPSGPSTGVAPWQDDFFTWSMGYLYELGYTNALPMLQWKAKFPVLRMADPQYCWVDGANYSLAIRPSASGAVFTTIGQAYQATIRAADGSPLMNSTGQKYLDQPCGSQAQADWRTQKDRDARVARNAWVAGEMTGYASSAQGFPSNMQPALAVAAATGIPGAQQAWMVFASRSVKPSYAGEPQFAIVPRK